MRIGYLDCFSGVSGDMLLAALVSAGWPAAELERLPGRLGLEGVTVTVSETRRGPFTASRVEVGVGAPQPHRHLHHIEKILSGADLTAVVRDLALRTFRRLAEAEAEVHGSTVEKVHFHEVGAADALVDVTGAIEGMQALGIEKLYASTLRLGRGSVQSEHGLIPIPAPATSLLVRGIPVAITSIDAELVTPTGAALVTTLVEDWSSPPAFTLRSVGIGAGGRDLTEQPNVLRLFVGDTEDAGPARRRVAVLETALDDESPQRLGALIPALLEQGALDAMLVPATMKKGRPGTWLVVISEPERADALARIILSETSTLGVRMREELRYELARRSEQVATPFGSVLVKVATLPDGTERATPEFESVRAAADRAGRPLREVAEAVLLAWSGKRA